MGEIVPFPEEPLSRQELFRLAAEAEILIEDTQKALEVAKDIRMYYLRRLGMIAMEDE